MLFVLWYSFDMTKEQLPQIEPAPILDLNNSRIASVVIDFACASDPRRIEMQKDESGTFVVTQTTYYRE